MSNITTTGGDWTQEQIELIKNTVAKNATDDEFKLFTYRCKHLNLDPFKPGQIHFVKYQNGPGTIIVGIEGFRSKAESTEKHAGTKRGVIRDESGKCIGAWCEVYRTDWKECAREEVSLHEYNTGKGPWAKMPETMIKKVAEAAALRIAFPDQLGGIYTSEEMDQASREAKPGEENATPPLEAEFSHDFERYVIPFGKYKGQKITDPDIFELNSYCAFIEEKAKRDGKPIQGVVKEFIEVAIEYLESKEYKHTGV